MNTTLHPIFEWRNVLKHGYINTFLIFALKHISWVLVRTASLGRFQRVPTIYVLIKNKKNITFIFHLKITILRDVKYRSILRGDVCVMYISSDCTSGASCSKLMTSLVNVSLKFQT